jgi:hypothetical protein
VVVTETADGEPLGIGRKSRIIPKSIERAVRARDHNCCTFPGCNNRRFLECHHVEHWANGGETTIENLLLLCTKHHTLVHEGGFRIDRDFMDNWAFFSPRWHRDTQLRLCCQAGRQSSRGRIVERRGKSCQGAGTATISALRRCGRA